MAGRAFASSSGHASLRYGCGSESFAPLQSSERWLVLQPESPDDFELLDGGARVFRATIEVDGPREEVLHFLAKSAARNLPHVGKSVSGGTGLVAVGGVDSELECTGAAARLCAGSRSKLSAGDWGLCVAGNHGVARSGRFGISVTGTSGQSVAGDGAIAVVAESGSAVAGIAGVAIGQGRARVSVGKGGTAIGTAQSLYRGDVGAVFIVRTGDPEHAEGGAFVATVGQAGVEAGKWYRFVDGAMIEFERAS